MNIFSNQIMLIITGILAIAIIVMAICISYLYRKLNRFLSGSEAVNLEDSLVTITGSIQDLEQFRDRLERDLAHVEARLKRSVQSVHTIRFNPFKGTGSGGNQSFATAFLNEEGDGVVMSSLYSREHVSVFSKPVRGGVSEYELSEEETNAMKGAEQSLKNFQKQK